MSISKQMDGKRFISDVYDNLMKNTNHNPIDFSKIDECSIDEEKNEIYIGRFILILKEQN
jgi:hypothetical protein